MSKQLITIDADSSAFEAAKKMSEKMVSSIVITDNDKTVGILTERDLIKQVCAADLQASSHIYYVSPTYCYIQRFSN